MSANELQDEIAQLRSSTDSIVEDIKKEIVERYQAPDGRPWILGFSGGKDSTLVAQLVFESLLKVPPRRRVRPIYILSSDTQVETPYIVEFVRTSLDLMKESAESLGVPLSTQLVTPELNDTFWVRMIGYGYPPPSKFMRWCTDRLKIRPANRFILQKISQHGEVVLLLGARYDESNARAKSLRSHQQADGLARHGTLPNAYVWSPIRHLTGEQVWAHLVFHPSPWGGDNIALRDLYKSANAGECPLVVDETTEPCGNSRFGCYVCTVVDRDKSLEGFVLDGRDEYKDLLEFRNWLLELRNDPFYRETTRRNGQPGVGPLRIPVRGQILARLLEIQARLGEELISEEEILAIKHAWVADSLDVAGGETEESRLPRTRRIPLNARSAT